MNAHAGMTADKDDHLVLRAYRNHSFGSTLIHLLFLPIGKDLDEGEPSQFRQFGLLLQLEFILVGKLSKHHKWNL